MSTQAPAKPASESLLDKNGCARTYKAIAVLVKAGTHGLCVMREMTIADGRVISWKDTVEDLFDTQLAKANEVIILDKGR